MAGPTDEQGAAGVLLVRLGRDTREVPVLPIKFAKPWKRHLWEALGEIKGATPQADLVSIAEMDPEAAATALEDRVLALEDLTEERMLDLVVEYDREGALGGREAIEAVASAKQIRVALDAMKDECLPNAGELTLMNMIQVVAARSTPPSSTNGHSPTGALPRDHLKPRSRTASSTSSGKRGRTG